MKRKEKTKNIFLSGVGGQGTILAGNLLADVFLNAGYDVKKAEVHGMAQRGGVVTTHFRFGEKVYSPLIKHGDADFLLSFELLEALRHINWVKSAGKIIISNHAVFPPAVNLGQVEYPGNIDEIFSKYFKGSCWMINAQEIARNAGNVQAANIVLVGAFSNFFSEINEDKWVDSLKKILPPKLHDLNLDAFNRGKNALKQ